MTLGRHINSLTLVPGEEIEIEVFRSFKTSHEVRESRSTTEEWTRNFVNPTLTDGFWDRLQGVAETEVGAWAGYVVDFFRLGSQVFLDVLEGAFNFDSAIDGAEEPSTQRTNATSDISVTLRTESEVSTRESRRLRNFNVCQTVTYHFFQIQQKYGLKINRLEPVYDAPDQDEIPRVFTQRADLLLSKYRFDPVLPVDAVNTPLAASARVVSEAGVVGREVPPFRGSERPYSVKVARPLLESPLTSRFRRIPKARFLLDPRVRGIPGFEDELETEIHNKLPSTTLVDRQFCVDVPGVHAEAMTGTCAACDTHTVLLRDLERQKLELEGNGLKQTLHASAAVTGFVMSAVGPVAGAVITLKDAVTSAVVEEGASDREGFFAINGAALLAASSSYKVSVSVIPAPFTTATVPPAFTWSGAQVQISFVLA